MDDSSEQCISFHGNIDVPNDEPAGITATIRFPRWDPTKLVVHLLWLGAENKRRRGSYTLENLGKNHVWLNSLDPIKAPVELLGINEVKTQYPGAVAHDSSIRVAAVQVGITKDCQSQACEFDTIVRLQPSGVLLLPSIQNQMYTGEILIDKQNTGDVKVQLGNAKLIAGVTYDFNTTEEFGNKVTNRIQQSTLIGKMRIESGESLFDVHEAFLSNLADTCIALSLCYRQVVDFYEIEYIASGTNVDRSSSVHRRRWNAFKTKTTDDELINTRSLVNGGLQRLITGIQKFPRSKDLRRAIKFISASYTANTEVAYFMTFSAMETILSCCLDKSDEIVLGPSKWDKVRRGLRKTIEEIIPDDTDVQDVLISKLPELRRSTLRHRMNEACQKYKPKIDDLWTDISFEDGIKRSTKIRNGLFHAADYSEVDSIGEDLIRIRTFSERLVLRLLTWPDDDIWVWYNQNLKWINQGNR